MFIKYYPLASQHTNTLKHELRTCNWRKCVKRNETEQKQAENCFKKLKNQRKKNLFFLIKYVKSGKRGVFDIKHIYSLTFSSNNQMKWEKNCEEKVENIIKIKNEAM